MPTHVLGTAGHVDHGKSSLVTALTGMNPDRLKEEQAREMTIELGFAWFKLPTGEEVGIVDVPGHRDFIENMLAGVGGIDAVLFVIAADEGVMPQTREHLAILDLLQISNGIIVLTKCDLISDKEWLTLVEDDIRKTVRDTVLAESPIIRVSSRTREGIPLLLEEISNILEKCPPRIDIHQPRLPIDRVFSMPGFGTIVTGTLTDGSFKIADEITILPAGIKSRIRGLQNHKTKVDLVIPGQRTAINIAGVAVEDIKRGDVITFPGLYPPTKRIDVQFSLLIDISGSLKHRSEVKFFIGTTEVLGSIRLLGMEELTPGNNAFLQIELFEPIVTKKGDRFILRRPSPGETLGGGTIIEVSSPRRYKRFAVETLALLEKKLSGSPSEKVLSIIHTESPILVSDVLKKSNIDSTETMDIIRSLQAESQIKVIKSSENITQNHVVSWNYLQNTLQATRQILEKFHSSNPLKTGISREELRSKLKLNSKIFTLIIEDWISEGELKSNLANLSLPGFSINILPEQQKLIQSLRAKFSQNPVSPPSVKECKEELGEDLFRMLIERGDLIQLSEDVVYSSDQYEKLKNEVIAYLQKNSTITVADFRDQYQTSRKYALAVLEYLDQINITRREGDFRKLSMH
jgi:selenocysteine-specific elongation factor